MNFFLMLEDIEESKKKMPPNLFSLPRNKNDENIAMIKNNNKYFDDKTNSASVNESKF